MDIGDEAGRLVVLLWELDQRESVSRMAVSWDSVVLFVLADRSTGEVNGELLVSILICSPRKPLTMCLLPIISGDVLLS